jgi:hypothetical protein
MVYIISFDSHQLAYTFVFLPCFQDAYMNLALTGMLVPSFTELGYAVVKQPPGVHERLLESLWEGGKDEDGRPKGKNFEKKVDQISGDKCRFASIGRLEKTLLDEMKEMHETWSGVSLVPMQAYGLRIYEPGNSLTMHTDRIDSHVISSIVHVDRDTNEPWPIVIEGFDGKIAEVDLQPGEMLFYESSKCIHGRPRPLNGKWYTSLFMHYRPRDWTLTNNDAKKLAEPLFESRAGGPEPLNEEELASLQMRGTGFYEPGCKNEWCGLSPVWPLPAVETGGEDAREL